MSGKGICRLMRANHITIRQLAEKMGITLKRVREVRAAGLTDPAYVRDWREAITGYSGRTVGGQPR